MFEYFSIKGKVALVTGAGGGLGAEIADALAESGSSVICCDLNLEGLEDTVNRLRKYGNKVLGLACDMGKERDVNNMFAQIEEEFGYLDILVNNAGVADRVPTMTHELATDEWNRVVDINLNGVFYACRSALRMMVPRKSGKIINIASIWGIAGSATFMPLPAYTATKGAIVNFTRELGLEYAPMGINVNAICPGFFETRINDGIFDNDEFKKKCIDYTPANRIARPEEIKGTALYLASAASDFTCGHALIVDGGVMAR